MPGGVAGAAHGRPVPSRCGSSCPQPVAPLGLCRRQAQRRSSSELPLCWSLPAHMCRHWEAAGGTGTLSQCYP